MYDEGLRLAKVLLVSGILVIMLIVGVLFIGVHSNASGNLDTVSAKNNINVTNNISGGNVSVNINVNQNDDRTEFVEKTSPVVVKEERPLSSKLGSFISSFMFVGAILSLIYNVRNNKDGNAKWWITGLWFGLWFGGILVYNLSKVVGAAFLGGM